jgi:uncharacterized membrane protein YgcG
MPTLRWLRATWSVATRLLLALLGLFLLALGLAFARDFIGARPTHVIGWGMAVGALAVAVTGHMPRWLRQALEVVEEALPGGGGHDADSSGGGGFSGGGASGSFRW